MSPDPQSSSPSPGRTDPDDTPGDTPDDTPDDGQRRRTVGEIWIVLGLSLGQSAVYAAISLIGKLTAGPPLSAQRATVNASVSPRPYLDLTYQLAGIVFTLMPVVLALWLLSGSAGSLRAALRGLGLDRREPLRDIGFGVVLAAVIGIPGLGLYYLGRELGVTAEIVAAALNPAWWTVPVLLLQAVKNAVLEEVLVVGYLVTRLRALGWPVWTITAGSALLRGAYHLYQGFGPFVGNVVMGIVFAQWYQRGGRVMPLVIAHTLLDVVAFVGYQFLLR